MNTMDTLNDLLSKPAIDVEDILDKVNFVDIEFRTLKWLPTEANVDGLREHMEELDYSEPDGEKHNSHLKYLKNLDPDFEENESYYTTCGAVCATCTFEGGEFVYAVYESDDILNEGLPDLSSTITHWVNDFDYISEISVDLSKFVRTFGSHEEYELYDQTNYVLQEHYGTDEGYCCEQSGIGKPIVYRISYENDKDNVTYYALDEEGRYFYDVDTLYDLLDSFFAKLNKLA